MSAENPAVVANVPISKKSGTVARSTLESTPAGSLASSVSAGPQLDCSATPTTPTIIMAKPIGTCSRINANRAASPSAPITSDVTARSFFKHPGPVARRDDQLHQHRRPEDYVDAEPERRDRDLQHE